MKFLRTCNEMPVDTPLLLTGFRQPPNLLRGLYGFLYCIAVVLFSIRVASAEPIAPTWLEVPRQSVPSPLFSLPQLNGDSLDLAAQAGTPVLVHFWASFCKPCLKELPALKQLATDCNGSLKIITIAVDRGSPRAVERVVTRLGFDLPVGLDADGNARKQYEIVGLPTSYFLDAELRIRGRTLGQREWQSAEALTTIQTLLGACK